MSFALVGDIGGTNARFSLCDIESGEISATRVYSGLDYDTLEACARQYLKDVDTSVEHACIAIACPIMGDWVQMTNHTWAFSTAEMKKNMGTATCAKAMLIVRLSTSYTPIPSRLEFNMTLGALT